MTGISLGGMHTWLAAAADERVAAAAPMIGVQESGGLVSGAGIGVPGGTGTRDSV